MDAIKKECVPTKKRERTEPGKRRKTKHNPGKERKCKPKSQRKTAKDQQKARKKQEGITKRKNIRSPGNNTTHQESPKRSVPGRFKAKDVEEKGKAKKAYRKQSKRQKTVYHHYKKVNIKEPGRRIGINTINKPIEISKKCKKEKERSGPPQGRHPQPRTLHAEAGHKEENTNKKKTPPVQWLENMAEENRHGHKDPGNAKSRKRKQLHRISNPTAPRPGG